MVALVIASRSQVAREQEAGRAANAGPAFAAPAHDLVGATITAQNWQQCREFMPDGMAALFEGKYFWKMLSDVEMEVGSTVVHPLPKNYLDPTEKYSGKVRLVDLPDGHLTGYPTTRTGSV